MANTPESPPPLLLLERHPSERRQQRRDHVVLYSCCCCCCCCLHTLGGLVGAVNGGNFRAEIDAFDAGPPAAARKLPSTQFLYWTSLLIVMGLVLAGCFVFLVNTPSYNPGQALVTMLLSFVLAGPLFSLGASLVMAIRVALRSDLRPHRGYWSSLGRITGFSLLGTLIGTAVMWIVIAGFMSF